MRLHDSAWLGVVFVTIGCGSGPSAPSTRSVPAAAFLTVAGVFLTPPTVAASTRADLWPGFIEVTAAATQGFQANLTAAAGTPPAAPNLATPEINGTTVTLRWTSNPLGGAPSSYIIEYGTSPGSPIGSLNTGNTSTGYVAAGVGTGTYYIRVRAVNDGGVSSASNEEVARVGGATTCLGIPAAPVLTSQVTGSDVFLAWTRATSTDTYALEVNGSVLMQGYTSATLTNTNTGAGTYRVRVRATNACGTGDWSNAVVLTVGGPAPSQAYSCDGEATARSISDTSTATLEFVNASASTRYVYWLNYQGARVLYSTLAPGRSLTQPTYMTHPWVVTTSSGSCLGIYLPATTLTRVTVTDTPPTVPPYPGTTTTTTTTTVAPGTFSISPTSRDFGTNGGCSGATLTLPITVTAGSDVSWTVGSSGSDFPGDRYHSATLSATSGRGSSTVNLLITIPRQTPPSYSSCSLTINYTFSDTITFTSSNGISLSVAVRYTYVSVLGA